MPGAYWTGKRWKIQYTDKTEDKVAERRVRDARKRKGKTKLEISTSVVAKEYAAELQGDDLLLELLLAQNDLVVEDLQYGFGGIDPNVAFSLMSSKSDAEFRRKCAAVWKQMLADYGLPPMNVERVAETPKYQSLRKIGEMLHLRTAKEFQIAFELQLHPIRETLQSSKADALKLLAEAAVTRSNQCALRIACRRIRGREEAVSGSSLAEEFGISRRQLGRIFTRIEIRDAISQQF